MDILVNGQPKAVTGPLSAETLIKTSCQQPELVMCELNGTILERSQWASMMLKPNDKIELVSFVGGG